VVGDSVAGGLAGFGQGGKASPRVASLEGVLGRLLRRRALVQGEKLPYSQVARARPLADPPRPRRCTDRTPPGCGARSNVGVPELGHRVPRHLLSLQEVALEGLRLDLRRHGHRLLPGGDAFSSEADASALLGGAPAVLRQVPEAWKPLQRGVLPASSASPSRTQSAASGSPCTAAVRASASPRVAAVSEPAWSPAASSASEWAS